MGAALLYAIVWVVCYRGRPARATAVRVVWLAAIAVLFAVTALAHRFAVPQEFYTDLSVPPPLIATPAFGGALAAFYVGLAVLRVILARAARSGSTPVVGR